MTSIFVAVSAVMILLILFIAVAIRVVAENADKRIDNYFLSKLEEYDNEFKEKINTMEELEAQKKKLEEEIDNLKFEQNSLETPKFYRPRPVIRDTYIPIAHYIDSGFFNDYKIAKQMLNLNFERIIRGVLERNPYTGNIERYNTAMEIREILNYMAVYDMVTMPGKDQMQVFLQGLAGSQMAMLLDYIKTLDLDNGVFDILEFIKWLEKVIRNESPILAAYFAEPKDFSYISPYVKCYVDKNVCDGVRIIYQGRLHDYSIYETSIYETNILREG